MDAGIGVQRWRAIAPALMGHPHVASFQELAMHPTWCHSAEQHPPGHVVEQLGSLPSSPEHVCKSDAESSSLV